MAGLGSLRLRRAVVAALAVVVIATGLIATPLATSPAAADHGAGVSHDQAAFVSGLENPVLENFDAFADNTTMGAGQVTGVDFSSDNSRLYILNNVAASSAPNLLWAETPTGSRPYQYRLTFTKPASAVGFNLADVHPNGTAPTVTVSFTAGEPITFSVPDTDADVRTPLYFAYERPTADISTVVVESGFESPDVGSGAEEMGIDDLAFVLGVTPPAATPADSIVFSKDDGTTQIWTMSPDGSDARQLTTGPGPNSDPRWSPDGRSVAFVSTRDGSPDIYVVDVATGEETRLTADPGHDADPAWSPDGTRIAFASNRGGSDSFDVYEMPAGGESVDFPATNLTNDETGAWDSFPAYDASGSILFQSMGRTGSDFDIFRRQVFVSGSGEFVTVEVVIQPVTVNDVHDQGVDGSPIDAGVVAFARADASGTYSIVVSDGGAERGVTPVGENADTPAFSPDAASIGYVRRDGANADLRLVPAVGSAPSTALTATAEVREEAPSWFSSLRITTDVTDVGASPAKVPTRDVPSQHKSPHAVETAPLELTPALTPLELTPALTPLELTPALVPLELTPALAPLELTPALTPLELTPALTPAALEELKRIPFSSITIAPPGGPEAILDGSALSGRPLQDLSVFDVALDQVAGPRLRSLLWESFDLRAALGHVGVGMFLLGDTRLDDIDSDHLPWCDILTGLGYGAAGECGGATLTANDASGAPDPRKGLSARPLDLAIAGLPFDDENHPIDLHRARLADIRLAADAELLQAKLADTELLRTTNYGAVRVSDLPGSTRLDPTLIDCSGGWCSSGVSLYDAAVQNRLGSGFQFRHLGTAFDHATLGEAIYGLFGVDTVPYEDYTTDQLGILTYNDPEAPAGRITYTVNHREHVGDGGHRTLDLRLSPSMVPLPATANLTIAGTPTTALPTVVREADAVIVRWEYSSGEPGTDAVASVQVAPGVHIGTRTSGASVAGTDFRQVVENRAPVHVTENFEDNDSPLAATELETNVLHVGHAASGVDYYRVTVAPGDVAEVVLGNRESGDNDLVVYYPDGAAGVGADDRLVAAVANDPTTVPYDDHGTSPNRLGEPVAGGTLDDLDLLDRPVAGISDVRARANERVSFLALPVSSGPSEYLIQVSSYLVNGSFGPYTLRVTTRSAPEPPACVARDGVSSLTREGTTLSLPATVAADRNTLILLNEDRLRELYPADDVEQMLATAQNLANHPKVNGVLLPLDDDSTFRARFHDWDLNPCDPFASNRAFRAGHDVIDRVTAESGADIKHVVLLGSGETLPKALKPDGTQVGNESNWTNEIRGLFAAANNSVLGAGANLPTDDPWGATVAVPYGPRYLYLPSRGVGRLVDSPGDIEAAMQRFLDSDGRLERKTAFTAGGYFMKDLATEVDRLMEQNTGAAQPHRADDTWNRDDVLNSSVAKADPPDFVSLNTHANPFASGPPGSPASPFRSSDLDAAGAKLGGTVLYGIGCHTGSEFADVLMSSPSAEFGQAATRNGGLLVGQTGYGLGLEHRLAFSERLLVEFTRRLDGSLTIGEAMVAAKRAYLPVLSPYDEKALNEINLFGLPMFEVGAPTTPPAPASDAVPAGIDSRSGLQTATISLSPNLVKVDTPDGDYYEQPTGGAPGTGQTLDVQYRPVQARIDLDVTQSFGAARGAWVTARTDAADETGFDPLFVAPALSGASADPVEAQPGDVIFPAAPLTLQGAGDRQTLSVVPTQFESTGQVAGKTVGRSSRSTSMGITVFYAPPGSTDVDAPTIRSVGAVKQDGLVTFIAEAEDDEGAILRGSVLFEDSSGVHLVELAPSASDGNGLWTAVAPYNGSTVRYETRFLDAGANVAITKNKGGDFEAAEAIDAPEGVTARILGTATGGYYGNDAQVELAGAGMSFEYRLDGDQAWHQYAAPVPVTGDGSHVFAYRASSGATGVLVVPIDTKAPHIMIKAPIAGGTYRPGERIVADFECLDSSGTTCAGAVGGSVVEDGGALPSTPGKHNLVVTATDGSGKTNTATVTYHVTYAFEGFFSPVRMDALNAVKAGSTVPMKWRLRDADGLVRSLDVVDVLQSRRVECPSQLPLVTLSLVNLPLDTLHYDLLGEQYVYGWKTDKMWAQTCRTFDLLLDDGSKHRAQFKFH